MYVRSMKEWRNVRSLRWKFMLAPLLGVVMMTALSVILIMMSHDLIEEDAALQEEGFSRALTITRLSSRLAVNHANIYRLLGSVSPETDEGEFYDASKTLLYEIDNALERLEEEAGDTPPEHQAAPHLTVLVKDVAKYRTAATNAMLMATVDPELAQRVMAESTSYFIDLNASLISMSELIQQDLSRQLAANRITAEKQIQFFVILLFLAIAVMLIIGGILAHFLSRDLNHLVSHLGSLVSWNNGATSFRDGDEVTTLALAIDRVRESYRSLDRARTELDATNRQLSESNKTIQEREKMLAELNAQLRVKVREQEDYIESQRRAEAARDKAIEEAERASRVKSEFLATMSHELRTPLNAIMGFSEAMRLGSLGPIEDRYRNYAQYIHLSGEHLLRLISDVLDISRIEDGTLEVTIGEIEVGEIFSACRTILGGQAKSAGLALAFEVDPSLRPIRTDDGRLKQVLLNLIGNAIKFTPPGGRITVAAAPEPSGGIVLSVSDTGIGIARQDIPTALEKFGQIREGVLQAHDGMGIGLTLSKYLVELLGGTLEIESEVGRGTTVYVRLPESPPLRA